MLRRDRRLRVFFYGRLPSASALPASAVTVAKMPAFTASGSFDHNATTAARSDGNEAPHLTPRQSSLIP